MAISRSTRSNGHYARRSTPSKRLPPETLVQVGGLLSDCRPRKFALDSLTASAHHTLAQRRIPQEVIDRRSQVGTELLWIEWLKRTFSLLLQSHEHASLAVDHDFGDAAHGAGHDRRAAGHRLQVDDPEGFVDRRATEYRRVAVELDDRVARQHLLDPDHTISLALRVGDGLLHLTGNLRGIRRAGAQHYLRGGIDQRNGASEVDDALLTSDASHEQRVRRVRIHTMALEGIGRRNWSVDAGIDAVVDDVHPLGTHVGDAQKVVARALRNGDDRVGHRQRSLLDP